MAVDFNITLNWFFRDIDDELRKYVWLHFEQQQNKKIAEMHLSPVYKRLKKLHTDLEVITNESSELSNAFPKKLTSVDMQSLRLLYKKQFADATTEKKLNRIKNHYKPELKTC